MNDDRRNPYLVLGVPFGSGREEATTAFAQRSRRARREADFPYDVDDLTWALNQVESHITNPASDIDTYRVPADPAALRPPIGEGLLRLRPVPLERRTAPTTATDMASLEELAAREELERLLDQGAEAARTRYDLDAAPGMVVLRLGRARRRRWPWLVLILVLGLAGAAVAIAVASTSSNRARAVPAATTVVTTSSMPATTTTEPAITDIGPISTLAPDEYSSSSWTDVDMNAVAVGACFSFVGDAGSASTATAEPSPCDGPHRHQLYAAETLGEDVVDYVSVDQVAQDVCAWIFSSFVGVAPDQSQLSFATIVPAESAWPADRVVLCYVTFADERGWIGTARGSGV